MFFTVEKIEKQLTEILAAIHRGVQDIPQFKFSQGECPGAHRPDFDDRGWADFNLGDLWGGYDIDAWFRARVPVPPGWRDKKLVLRFLVGPRDGGDSTAETLLYVNGQPLQGLDDWHEKAWLPPELAQAGEISVALRAWSGVLGVPERRRFKLAQLIWIDEAAERLYYLADTLIKAVKTLDENDLRRVTLLQAVNQAFHRVDFGKPGSPQFYQSLEDAAQFLKERVNEQACQELKPTVIGVGHAHLDMAWLWRLRHTREKAARTFATALHLMRQYPGYCFVHSSPQLYKFLKQDHPEIFARVKRKIESGEWEITGATWVEPDTNIPSGESLVRQFLFGLRYARAEFGLDMKLLWLPDVFGYSWALPQIIRKSGVKYFMTTKISWNQFNRFPHDTFRWRGLDGSEVLTHFVTTPEENSRIYTYNCQLRPSDVQGIWAAYHQKEVNDELLLLFGWGDGGGGPTQEMLESGLAMRNLPGLPRVELGKAEPYFERLERRVAGADLPVWDGELYLEYHRGTYTSQAHIKRANRKAEVLYHNAEWLSALADVLTGQSNYPAEMLNAGWEMILLNQFHDILPGSSIRQVYQDSHQDHKTITQIGEQAVERAQAALLHHIAADQDSLVVFNSLAWERDDLIEMPWSEQLAGKTLGCDGQPLPMQVVESGGAKKLLLEVKGLPPLGYRAFPWVDCIPTPAGQEMENEIKVTPTRLENCYYRIELNPQGQIQRLFDKRIARKVLAPNARGNVFQTFEDKPMDFDAWDIDIYYQEKMRQVDDLVEAVVEEAGPLRGVLRLRWRLGDSAITQRLVLYSGSPRIDLHTEIDWREQQVLLKVAFPVAVRSTRATYDIQFGNIERPTHWNTSWDYARFEVVGHKWADLSEGNYGVALLNDCKYGYDIKGNVMRLTLIKSAINPDALADKGRHVFTYSLLPHTGGWREGGVAQEAYELNYPVWACPAQAHQGNLPACYQFATLDADHVILETVKKAEDDEAWIARLYEYKQCRNNAVSLDFGRPVRAAECNLMEQAESPVVCQDGRLTFAIAPYEIKTFKVWF